ncbi:MAG: YcxB family protein, partial [Acidobacteriota bacterium]|nr:YcxB family protein [Acidobacteriota bacterium]
MEFTAPVTERDYVRAYWLNCKSGFRTFASILIYLATAFFWTIVIASWIYAKIHPVSNSGQYAQVVASILLPFAVLLSLWILIFRVLVPFVVRGRYRREGLAGVNVSFNVHEEGLHIQPSKFAAEMTSWSHFRYWRESPELIVVGINLKKYCILPKGTLDIEQQNTLRAVLIAV